MRFRRLPPKSEELSKLKMMFHRGVVLVLTLLVSLSMSSMEDLESDTDQTGWIHPNDMAMDTKPVKTNSMHDKLKQVKQKMGTGKRVNDPNKASSSASSSASMLNKMSEISNCADAERKLDTCERKIKDLNCTKEDNTDTTSKSSQEKTFFQRHVRFLLNKFPETDIAYVATVALKAEDVRVLKRFAGDHPVALADVDASLNRMMSSVREKKDSFKMEEDNELTLMSFLQFNSMPPASDMILYAAVFSSVALVLWLLWRGMSTFRFTSLLFAVNFCWHWAYMHQKALAKKQATLFVDMPSECLPDELKSWMGYISGALFGSGLKQQCQRYQEALTIDAVLETSPVLVLTDMITQLVLHPVEHIGSTLGRFFGAVSGELSWASSLYVMPFVLILMVLMLVMTCGYEIRLPFFMGIRKAPREQVQPQVEQQKQEPTTTQPLLQQGGQVQQIQPQQTDVSQELLEQMALELGQVQQQLQKEKQKSDFLAYQVALAEREELAPTHATPPTRRKNQLMTSRVDDIKSTPEVQKTPVKKLVVRGDVTSPEGTVFEWIDTAEPDRVTLDDLDGLELPEEMLSSAMAGIEELTANDDSFTKKVKSLFEEGEKYEEEENARLGMND